MKERLFIGSVKSSRRFVGEHSLPTKRKDKFGTLDPGFVRIAIVNTQYGTLKVPIKFLGKKVIITMEERKWVKFI